MEKLKAGASHIELLCKVDDIIDELEEVKSKQEKEIDRSYCFSKYEEGIKHLQENWKTLNLTGESSVIVTKAIQIASGVKSLSHLDYSELDKSRLKIPDLSEEIAAIKENERIEKKEVKKLRRKAIKKIINQELTVIAECTAVHGEIETTTAITKAAIKRIAKKLVKKLYQPE